jgi:hypothetical protein
VGNSPYRVLMVRSHLVLLCLLVFLAPSAIQAQEAGQGSGNKTESALPSLTATKECLKEGRSTECLDNLFREALKNHTTADVSSDSAF